MVIHLRYGAEEQIIRFKDIHLASWRYSCRIMQKITAIFELMRLDKPIGIYLLLWPALIALVISTKGHPILWQVGIVVLGSILVRSTGCIINDIWDRDLDGKVARTKTRPLPSQRLALEEAWLIFMVLGGLSLYLLTLVNSNTLIISVLFAGLIILYPLTKRFFIGPQLFLGITFNPVIIVFALTEQLSNPVMPYLFFAIASLTIAFDSFYGLTDKEDDLHLKIHSTPLWWGKKTLPIIMGFQIMSICLLGIIGKIDGLKWIWFVGLILMGVFFIFQHRLAREQKYLEAFKNNHWAGLFLLILVVGTYIF
jgi:4-hydroxybenzoate polyprenyltransferase